MKICVIGAGAIGGLLAVRFAAVGNEVSVVDKGIHLAAIQRDGLTLIGENGQRENTRLTAVSEVKKIGKQDLIILAVKAHYLDQIAQDLNHIVKKNSILLPVQNGIPWWYFHKHGGEYEGRSLFTLDPNGILKKFIDADQIIGCVVYPAASSDTAGVIRHVEGDRFPIGELDGQETERVKRLFDLFNSSSFKSRIISDIRSEIWLKAWGNMSFNPISALTHSTLVDICQFKETRELSVMMMQEAQIVAEKIGVTFRHTIEKRVQGAERVGAHKTSMLQDVEEGRSLETEALIGAILEIATWTDTPVPSIQAVYACVKLLNKQMLLKNSGIKFSAFG